VTKRDGSGPSRSALKRESQALQEMGERLVNLSPDALARIPMPDELNSAVQLARHIKERGGRHRQLQYIGKLMRQIDPQPIAEALEGLDTVHRNIAESEHRVEQWRDRLLREGPAAIATLQTEREGVDLPKLTKLTQEAVAESAAGKPPRAARVLFRYLRDEVFGAQR
jgi:ribosome-associated protein